MKLWMHKRSGQFVISYKVYARHELQPQQPTLYMFAYNEVGEALENEHGVTCIFPDTWNSHNEFEYIGEFD